MFYYLSESLTQQRFDETFLDIFQQLYFAGSKGKHVVFGDRKIIQRLSQEEDLSKPARRFFHTMHQKYTTYSSLNSLPLKVVLHPYNNISRNKLLDREVIHFPIKFASEHDLFDPAILLCEDIDDIDFYSIVWDYFAFRNNIKFSINYNPIGAGGCSNASRNFKALHKSNKVVLCILDSDKKFPSGETNSAIREIASYCSKKSNPYSISHCFHIEARDVENLISPLMYKNILNKNIPDLYLQTQHQSYLYIDIKGGTNVNQLLLSKNSKQNHYFKKIEAHMTHHNCQNYKQKTCDNRSCTCIFTIPLGSGVLRQILPEIKKLTNIQMTYYLKDSIVEKYWLSIGSEMLKYLCCSKYTNT